MYVPFSAMSSLTALNITTNTKWSVRWIILFLPILQKSGFSVRHMWCAEDTLWILWGIQIKGLYYGCISPGSTFHAGNVLPVGLCFYLFIFFTIRLVTMCFFMRILLVRLGLHSALTLLIATSSKVIKMLPELVKAFVMKWPWLSDWWAGDTGTQTVLVCLKYSLSGFQAFSPSLPTPRIAHWNKTFPYWKIWPRQLALLPRFTPHAKNPPPLLPPLL